MCMCHHTAQLQRPADLNCYVRSALTRQLKHSLSRGRRGPTPQGRRPFLIICCAHLTSAFFIAFNRPRLTRGSSSLVKDWSVRELKIEETFFLCFFKYHLRAGFVVHFDRLCIFSTKLRWINPTSKFPFYAYKYWPRSLQLGFHWRWFEPRLFKKTFHLLEMKQPCCIRLLLKERKSENIWGRSTNLNTVAQSSKW